MTDTRQQSDVLTVAEVAERFGVSVNWARKRAAAGETHFAQGIRFIRIGRRVVVSRHEVERALGIADEVTS